MKSANLRRVTVVGLIAAISLIVAACGSSNNNTTSTAKTAALPTTWELPGANAQNTRDVGGPINSTNVSTLGVAWTVPIVASGTFGAYATTPVVSNGVLYTQDLASNVYAINLSTGKLLWIKKYNSPNEGPDGVTVANGTVYGATATSAFALQAATGEQLWTKTLIRNGNEGIDMAPGYYNGTVYVSTVPGNAKAFYAGNGQGILWALNAETGAAKWKFETVPANLWSNEHTNINSGGGLWDPPTFDGKGNLYIGVSNPAPFLGTKKYPFGSSRPGADLYTDSIVKLDEQTGKLIWYYQLTPHDISDWDMENSPILAISNGTPIVIDAGKGGIAIAVNAQTGKLVWKKSVGIHNGKDNWGQEVEKEPSRFKTPITIEPGDLGGVESQLATNGKTVFLAINNLAVKYKGQSDTEAEFVGGFAAGKGELVALNVATGALEWKKELPTSAYGSATIANDVVFTTDFEGNLYAFETTTGKELWKTKLSAGTNAPVTVVGNTLITAGSFPQAAGQKALIIAYRPGATGTLATPTAPSTTTSTSKAAPTASNVIKIEANPTGLLKYTESSIHAKPGSDTISFTNNSPIEHDVVIATSSPEKILGQTPIFVKGTKSFKVTLPAGTYVYYCSVPGHREAGMEGKLTITESAG
ncbi:MAG TPA: PQQ-binding-like beta-propeller repeat protein [Solirubrobacteraceae bacterium]|jgi:outer membrane protein assembly factor BamB/plastocyanin|nr:PQQ-binding-like beta-propeller repeat protein [Solirubrobacteraceae bacterium]